MRATESVGGPICDRGASRLGPTIRLEGSSRRRPAVRGFIMVNDLPSFTMKAARFHTVKAPMKVEDIPDPQPSPRDVVLRVRGAGICHTDLHLQDGLIPLNMPVVLGHEIAGEVIDVGRDVTGIRKNDHAVVHFWNPCGRCRACLQGRAMQCESLWTRPAAGVSINGGYEEKCSVDMDRIVPLPTELPFDFASTLGCAGVTAHHAVNVAGDARSSDSVAIFGLGGVGLYGIQFSRNSGAYTIGIGRSPGKLRKAEQLGADAVVDASKGKVDEQVKKATNGRGADLIVDFLGSPESAKASVASLAIGGRYVLVGITPAELGFNPTDIIFKELSISGSLVGNKNEQADIVEMARSGRVKSIVTKTYQLDEINTGLDTLRRAETVGRSVILP